MGTNAGDPTWLAASRGLELRTADWMFFWIYSTLLPRNKPFLCRGLSLSSVGPVGWSVVPSAQGKGMLSPSRELD